MRSLLLFPFVLSLSLQVSAQGIITTVAGGGNGGDGSLAVNAYIDAPNDVLVDDTGNIYIATDLTILKVSGATGIISTLAGDPSCLCCTGGDGIPFSQARFCGASALAFDKNGNLYIADNGNHVVRKVDKTTGIISKVAGNWTAGYSGDGGLATSAQLRFPNDIALDTAGNLYIADERYVIRKVDAQTGIISTIAGNGVSGIWSNGYLATEVELGVLTGICVDGNGNVYFSDAGNRRIGKISTANVLSTYCGNGIPFPEGDGGSATLAQTYASSKIRMDTNNNLYLCDGYVRRIDAVSGIITRVAGVKGGGGYNGDGGPALDAYLYAPVCAFPDKQNNLYIADKLNYRIRKVSSITDVEETGSEGSVRIYYQPMGNISIIAPDKIQQLEIRTVNGMLISSLQPDSESVWIDLAGHPEGLYVLSLKIQNRYFHEKLIIP